METSKYLSGDEQVDELRKLAVERRCYTHFERYQDYLESGAITQAAMEKQIALELIARYNLKIDIPD